MLARLRGATARWGLGGCVTTGVALCLSAATAAAAPWGSDGRWTAGSPDALAGQGIWIWQVSESSGGDAGAIAARARASGMGTVFIKSGDGASAWPQFNAGFVRALKVGGMRVCAWHYVYGRNPVREARVGARAVREGADCLIVDAETEYEGRYGAARRYLTSLRLRIGADYPVGLSSFPYVDRHPGFPFSVFLGPGGAQFNLPQVYWRAIGHPVETAISRTYRLNSAYARPILPLGQLWQHPPAAQIRRFCELAILNGSLGFSWWDYQEASARDFSAAGRCTAAQPASGELRARPSSVAQRYPTLRARSRGDLVVWAQQHLAVAATGRYDAATRRAVAGVQRRAGLRATGRLDSATWPALLRRPARTIRWALHASTATARSASATQATPPPSTSRLPALGREIPAKRH